MSSARSSDQHGESGPLAHSILPADCLDDLHDARLKRLYDYWRDGCAGAEMPSRAAVDPLDFRYILGYVSLVEVELMPRRYRFRLDGSVLAMLSGMDYTGKYLDQLGIPDYIDFVAASYDRVVDRLRPYAYRKQGAFDTKTFDEETLILPLGREGKVEHLMVAVIPGDLAPEPGKVLL
jgi:hypothetical protein